MAKGKKKGHGNKKGGGHHKGHTANGTSASANGGKSKPHAKLTTQSWLNIDPHMRLQLLQQEAANGNAPRPKGLLNLGNTW
mmetsp:Transcript_4199/g.7376  ORF Transcript_4199/g.7376 Transcript_4199/m.7376 type:complete len:81 (-) Transcript_4199:2027-2269(-)